MTISAEPQQQRPLVASESVSAPEVVGPATPGQTAAALRRISWGAVFAGVVVTLITGFTLNLLGFGIGVGTINPATEQAPLSGLGTGALVWTTVSTLVSLFFGGFVAGRLAGLPSRMDGMLHGIVTWAVAMLVSILFIASATGRIVGGATGLLGDVAGMAGRGAASAGVGEREIQRGAQEARQAAERAAQRVKEVARDPKTAQVSEDVADAVSKGAIGTFIGLVLGALMAALGAALGAPQRALANWSRPPRGGRWTEEYELRPRRPAMTSG